MIRRALVCLVFVFAMTIPTAAHAYAWMIRHDYAGCTQCHADPSGGGLLTLYGRAQSDVLLRSRYGAAGAEEAEAGDVGQFAFGALKPPDNVLLGAATRVAYLYAKTPKAPADSRFILMQADLLGQVTFGRFRANASLGFMSDGARPASLVVFPGDDGFTAIVSRTHWLGVELGEDRDVLVRAGRMNLPFGLRSVEHTQWVRQATRVQINDGQQDGVAVAYNADKIRGEAMAILGNLLLRPVDYRTYGGAAYAEYAFTPAIAAGVSGLVTHSALDAVDLTPEWRHAYGPFARYAPKRWVVLSTEADLLFQSQPPSRTTGATNSTGLASMLQADFEPWQGLHFMGTGELMQKSFGTNGVSYAGWASTAWFFLPHADARIDGVYQSYGDTPTRRNVVSLLTQLHFLL